VPDKKFDLGDYVEVKDRIAIFYELYPKGSLVTGSPELMMVDGKPYFLLQAYAYRTPDDPHPGVGTSWMAIPGATTYTRGSEAENVETSAWGRAIGSLGILIDKSIASSQEIQNKREEEGTADNVAPKGGETEAMLGRVKRRGMIRKGSSAPFNVEARQAPDGVTVGFKLEVDADKAIPQVVIGGALGASLVAAYPDPTVLIGTAATVSGLLYNVRVGQKSWYRLHVDRFENDDWILPADKPEPTEAMPEPLFSAEEQAKLDAAIDAAAS
jgi:hypothetical protein